MRSKMTAGEKTKRQQKITAHVKDQVSRVDPQETIFQVLYADAVEKACGISRITFSEMKRAASASKTKLLDVKAWDENPGNEYSTPMPLMICITRKEKHRRP